MSETHPRSVAEIDDEVTKRLQRSRFSSLIAIAVLAFIVIVFAGSGGYVIYQQQHQINLLDRINSQQEHQILLVDRLSTQQERGLSSSCGFFRDIGELPIVLVPPVTRPSLITVTLIIDARKAYIGRMCPAELAPPAPSLMRWAHYYHLTVPSQ